MITSFIGIANMIVANPTNKNPEFRLCNTLFMTAVANIFVRISWYLLFCFASRTIYQTKSKQKVHRRDVRCHFLHHYTWWTNMHHRIFHICPKYLLRYKLYVVDLIWVETWECILELFNLLFGFIDVACNIFTF